MNDKVFSPLRYCCRTSWFAFAALVLPASEGEVTCWLPPHFAKCGGKLLRQRRENSPSMAVFVALGGGIFETHARSAQDGEGFLTAGLQTCVVGLGDMPWYTLRRCEHVDVVISKS